VGSLGRDELLLPAVQGIVYG
jgi:hypothetical protein